MAPAVTLFILLRRFLNPGRRMGLVGFPATLFIVLASALVTPAVGQTSAAIVEEINGNPPGVELMDYVDTGRVIKLGPQDSVVLSYLSSCIREVIRVGAVKVGIEQSIVLSGDIERTKVDCEATKMLQATGQTNDSASSIVRGKDASTLKPAPAPEFTIYGSSPIFQLDGDGALVVARLDQKGEYFALPIDSKQLLRGMFLDFAAEGKALTPGGVYGVRWARRLVSFKVDENAKPGRAPAIGRLLILAPRN